jgi:hypothetical protein
MLNSWFCYFIPMIVSNCALPLIIPSGKQAVFHKMASQFKTRIRITSAAIVTLFLLLKERGERKNARFWGRLVHFACLSSIFF